MSSSTSPKGRIIVGMSGGVDSSVAALLLKQQGYDVSGVFMKNWDEQDPEGPCQAEIDARDAMAVCDILGIPLDAVSFADEYWDKVFACFLEEYRGGRTPNPDILCNKEIKFRAFLDYALAQGAERIATGHYARVRCHEGEIQLLKGRDPGKDQSYFLYALGQPQLARVCFPLGEYDKGEIRAMAREAGFPNHGKKDSTGICFIGERNFSAFLERYLPAREGEIHDPEGHVLGRHHGLMFHTIGQRKGLGIGGRRDDSGEPWYVVGKDVERNILHVAQGAHHPLLYHGGLIAQDIHWISGRTPRFPLTAGARIRYRQADQACTVTPLDGGRCLVRFQDRQRAIAPGQSIVFYQGDVCLGGGIIASAIDDTASTPEAASG